MIGGIQQEALFVVQRMIPVPISVDTSERPWHARQDNDVMSNQACIRTETNHPHYWRFCQ